MRGGDGSENRGFQRRIVAVWGGEHRGDVALLACPVSELVSLPRGVVGIERRRKEDFSSKKRESVMILPQVHLRKPCYDFYFL